MLRSVLHGVEAKCVPLWVKPQRDMKRRKASGVFQKRRRRTHFLWLSVRVMPCEDTLKWTMVAVGAGLAASVSEMALAMAWGPVRDSISTELMYRTLQAGRVNPEYHGSKTWKMNMDDITCTLHFMCSINHCQIPQFSSTTPAGVLLYTKPTV